MDLLIYEKFNPKKLGEWFHFYLVFVSPDRKFRRVGICTELIKRSIDLAKKLDFQFGVAECTGIYSQKAFLRIPGFKLTSEIRYDDWQCNKNVGCQCEADDCRPFKGKTGEHASIQLMTIQFQ